MPKFPWFSHLVATLAFLSVTHGQHLPCRFASRYTTSSILRNPDKFERDLLNWEGMFHQNNVSYNALNGMTFDGTLLDPATGIHNINGLHTFSAPSKESLHMMLLAQVIQGNSGAAQWILAVHGGGTNIEKARALAIDILKTKWTTYMTFNASFPGYGALLPWYVHLLYTKLDFPTTAKLPLGSQTPERHPLPRRGIGSTVSLLLTMGRTYGGYTP